MFLVFNFKDLSNAVLTLVQLLVLAMIFIVFPFWFLQTLLYLATSSGWYLVAGLALLVGGFFFALMKKQMKLATLLGIAGLAMAVCVMVVGHNMRTNAVEFGSPRNVLWVESLEPHSHMSLNCRVGVHASSTRCPRVTVEPPK